jgi:hypothetical protein
MPQSAPNLHVRLCHLTCPVPCFYRRLIQNQQVCVMQPMVAFKNALQEGRPLPRTPLALYRGLVVGPLGGAGAWDKARQ